MIMTPTPVDLADWRNTCAVYESRYMIKGEPETSTIADKLCTRLLRATDACEALIAERDDWRNQAILNHRLFDQARARIRELEILAEGMKVNL